VLPPWAPGAGIPTFSPDGRKILFSFWCIYGDGCPAATRTRRNARLATVDANGRGLRVLPLKVWADSGAWAPSGTRIVYRCRSARDRANLVFNLCVSRPDGGGLKVIPLRLGSAQPSWGTHL
jgi:hypothetical protein